MTATPNLTLDEEWRPIAGFSDYEVSNLGRVRSWKARGGRSKGRRAEEPRITKAWPSNQGYLRVNIRNDNGEPKTMSIHRLVALAFVEGRENGPLVCHNDSNRINNVWTNLRWDTPAGNAIDCSKLGEIPRQVLTEEQVREIRSLYEAGEHTHRSLGALFGVTHQAIRDLLVRKNYRWVA